MAGICLVILAFQLGLKSKSVIAKDFFNLSILALLVSLASFLSMVLNNTEDNSYAWYFISMWVWLGGGYTLVQWIKLIHGHVSVAITCNYLIAVCVGQCFLAYAINVIPALTQFVDGFLGGEAFMGRAEGRLYGIGCALDVAGFRFSAILVMIVCLLVNGKKEQRCYVPLYLLAFLVILILGNMIARSTIIGVFVAMSYLLLCNVGVNSSSRSNSSYIWKWLGIIVTVLIPIVVYLYYTNYTFYENLRFGFEGFFNLWEKGKWEVNSNEILIDHMIRFPETTKTWIIGDGYAANPYNDPNYIGRMWHGFYMGTDIGYLRFLFYFGIIGTLAFIIFICYAAWSCMQRFPNYQLMFFLILVVNLIGWCKVTTDIFLVFAIFLCITPNEHVENKIDSFILK